MNDTIRLGLDFYDTISVAPKIYRKLAHSVIAGGGEVHIITAVAPQNVRRVQTAIRRARVPTTCVHVVTFTNYQDVPQLKAAKAKELKLDMFVDDRLDTCQRMYGTRILALQSLGENA